MTLTPEQERQREGKITGSDMPTIMNGSAEQILELYKRKIGEAPPLDFSRHWRVQVGNVMEPLIRHWYEMLNNTTLQRVGEVVTSAQFPWAAATLDGFIDELRAPFEAKWTGGWEAIDVIINRYQPQVQWQMMVCEAQQCALSVAMAEREPIVTFIDEAPDYIKAMVERADYFQQCVALCRPPVNLQPVPPPIEPFAIADMIGNAKWQRFAGVWLQTRGAAEEFEHAKASLKALVPEEAKVAHGYGVRITRDRANRMHVKVDDGG